MPTSAKTPTQQSNLLGGSQKHLVNFQLTQPLLEKVEHVGHSDTFADMSAVVGDGYYAVGIDLFQCVSQAFDGPAHFDLCVLGLRWGRENDLYSVGLRDFYAERGRILEIG
jgi:hypothetical protein